MSVLLYGPRGIGKKTIIDCLASSSAKEFGAGVHFYRVDLDTYYLDRWSHENCRWELDEDGDSARATRTERESTTIGESEDGFPMARAADETPSNAVVTQPTSPDQNILVKWMLDRLDRKLADKVSSDYAIVFLGGFKELPLSGFSSLQIGKLQQWIRQGVSLILVSPENLSETSGRFGDLYQKDVQKWVRYAVGLLPSDQAAQTAARLLYKMSQDAEPTEELLRTLIAVAGPHPGQIAFALENPETDWVNASADLLKDNLMRKFKDYQDSYHIIWTSLEPLEKRFLATTALVQLGVARDQHTAEQDLSERSVDWFVDVAPNLGEEIKNQLASPRRRYGQLLLPWEHDRIFSQAFAEFIVRQIPKPVAAKKTSKVFRRDVLFLLVASMTLLGFLSILLSLINRPWSLTLAVVILMVASIIIVVYAVMFFIQAIRSQG